MKKIIWMGLAVFLVLGPSLTSADDIRIGYVDLRKVMTESKSGLKTKNEIEKTIKDRRESLNKEGEQLKSAQEAFEKEKLLLTANQRTAKQKELDERVRAFQKARVDAQREIQQKEQEFTSKALPQIRAIIHDVAKEQKLTLVFEKNEAPVLYAIDGPDLTDKIIQRFNAKGGS